MNKILFLFILILFSFSLGLAQPGGPEPLEQTEYVRLLYAMEKNPAVRTELIDAIRTRGLGFELTDGLRSLTRTKTRNDREVQRALEESERRRINPDAAKLPSAREALEVLERAREANLAAVGDMPDFVVKQNIVRQAAYAGTNNFRNLDKLIVGVSYRASGFEEYKVLSINGVLQNNPSPKGSYEEVGGTSSTGEFVTVLEVIFKPESDTKFEIVDTDTIRARRTIVFDYSIERDKARQRISTSRYISESIITGMRGRIWIDRENFRVLRVESEATEIPGNFPVQTARRIIDYDWVSISDEKYLLPSVSDVRLTFRQNRDVFETRNLIRFKDYQKFGTEVIVLDDEEVEDAPAENPAPLSDDEPPPLKP